MHQAAFPLPPRRKPRKLREVSGSPLVLTAFGKSGGLRDDGSGTTPSLTSLTHIPHLSSRWIPSPTSNEDPGLTAPFATPPCYPADRALAELGGRGEGRMTPSPQRLSTGVGRGSIVSRATTQTQSLRCIRACGLSSRLSPATHSSLVRKTPELRSRTLAAYSLPPANPLSHLGTLPTEYSPAVGFPDGQQPAESERLKSNVYAGHWG